MSTIAITTRCGPKPKLARNAKILALRGKKSTALIAEALGVSIGTVAGVCFRADYPRPVRLKRSPCGNKINSGHHGCGRYARRTRFGSKGVSP